MALHDSQECLDGTALKLHGFVLMFFQGSQLSEKDDLDNYVYATGLIWCYAFLCVYSNKECYNKMLYKL